MRFTITDTKFGNQTIIPGKFYYEIENNDRTLYLGAVDSSNACLIAIKIYSGNAVQTERPNVQYNGYGDSDLIQVKPELVVNSIYEANEFCNIRPGAPFEKDDRKFLKIGRYDIVQNPNDAESSVNRMEGGVDFETGEFVKFEPSDLVIELDASLSIKLID